MSDSDYKKLANDDDVLGGLGQKVAPNMRKVRSSLMELKQSESVHSLKSGGPSFSFTGEEEEDDLDFLESKGLTSSQATKLLAKFGKNELEEKTTPKWLVFLGLLTPPMPMMIWLAIATECMYIICFFNFLYTFFLTSHFAKVIS